MPASAESAEHTPSDFWENVEGKHGSQILHAANNYAHYESPRPIKIFLCVDVVLLSTWVSKGRNFTFAHKLICGQMVDDHLPTLESVGKSTFRGLGCCGPLASRGGAHYPESRLGLNI